MNLELTVEDDRWQGLESLSRQAISAVLSYAELDPGCCEVSVLGCDDARITELNAEFRGKPTETNVLSWPAEDLSPDQAGQVPQPPEPDFTGEIPLGDIAISFDTCAREADEAGMDFDAHVVHLLVHGTLHLLGYDHIRDPDAALMEGIEVGILGKLGIDDPYKV